MAEQMRVHDPQVLRAIAHPVRNRVLGELQAQGSLRAADVARALDIPANQASFHLRQLAKYGLVEEDPAAARDRRDRVWKVVHEGGLSITFSDLDEQPGGAAAADVYRRDAAAWGRYVVDTAFVDDRDDAIHRNVNNTTVRLTRDEAQQLAAELNATVERWVERTRGDHETERSTYLYYGVLQPHPRPADAAADDDEA